MDPPQVMQLTIESLFNLTEVPCLGAEDEGVGMLHSILSLKPNMLQLQQQTITGEQVTVDTVYQHISVDVSQ